MLAISKRVIRVQGKRRGKETKLAQAKAESNRYISDAYTINEEEELVSVANGGSWICCRIHKGYEPRPSSTFQYSASHF